MLSNFAQRFITAKNICAAAMRKSPRLRWKNDASGPRGSGDEGIASGATRAIYAVDDEEAFPEQRQCLDDAAAGLQQLVLRRDLDPRRRAPGEMRRDLLGFVMRVDDHGLDPGRLEPVDRVV